MPLYLYVLVMDTTFIKHELYYAPWFIIHMSSEAVGVTYVCYIYRH